MVEIDRLCANKNCSNPGKHLCSGCGSEIYCSKDCQKAHWPLHKAACKAAVKPESALFVKSFDSFSVKQLQNLIKAKASTLEGNKRTKLLERLEQVCEKPALVKLAKDHVHPEEVEALFTMPASAIKTVETSSSSSSSSRKKKSVQIEQQYATAAGNGMTPSPEQMRIQAQFMRKNPGMVRKAQPAMFGHLSDEQIRQYADQIEKAASDPNMMQEVERMSKLNNKDRELLQSIQEGVSGTRPITPEWIKSIVKALRTRPEVFKTMLKGKGAALGGMTDEQVESYIDMFSSMSEWLLEWIAFGIWYLTLAMKPLSQFYNTIDQYTFNSARYIFLALFGLLFYYFSLFSYYILKFLVVNIYAVVMMISAMVNGGNASSGSTSVPLNDVLTNAAQQAAAVVGSAAAGGGNAAAGNEDFEF